MQGLDLHVAELISALKSSRFYLNPFSLPSHGSASHWHFDFKSLLELEVQLQD